MSSGFDKLVSALEKRYDHYSARSVAREALSAASIDEGKLSDKEMQAVADQLATIGDGLDAVWGALGVAPTGSAPPAAPAKEEKAPAKEEAKADDAKADDAKADDAKADDAKAAAKKAATKKAASKKAAAKK